MTYVKVIQQYEAESPLKEIYEDIVKKRGKLSEVIKCTSLNPESIVRHMDLYLTIMFGKSPLKRVQREMIAVVVSKANACEYCQIHHAIALNHFWKDDSKISLFNKDFNTVDLDKKNSLLCQFAWQLTKKPYIDTKAIIEKMKAVGITDREIVDANLVISYFNFVNRLVIGLGVELEKSAGGYKYE